MERQKDRSVIPGGRKDFYNIADISRDFVKREESSVPASSPNYWSTVALLAQAQQLAVIAGHLGDIAESLRSICRKADSED